MLDSGSGNDLIDFRVVAPGADRISVGSSPLVLLTASGETRPYGEIDVRVRSLDEEIRAVALDNTPNVLGLCRRCMEQGYYFT